MKKVLLTAEVIEELKYEKNEWYTIRLEDGTKLTINKKYCDEKPFLGAERLKAFADQLEKDTTNMEPLPDVKVDTAFLQCLLDSED